MPKSEPSRLSNLIHYFTHFFSSFLKRFVTALISYFWLYSVITGVTPPDSWQAASVWQILTIFLPLVTVYMFTFNLFLNHLIVSFILALALLVLTVLQALHLINITNSAITLIIATILIWFFRRNRFRRTHPSPKKGLTNEPSIPKLTKLTTAKKENQ